MDLLRIAARIAARPKFFTFDCERHIYEPTVEKSEVLPVDVREGLLDVLHAKRLIQDVYNTHGDWAMRLDGMNHMARLADSALSKTERLMQACRGVLPGGMWNPEFDEAFALLRNWQWPVDPASYWHCDYWVQALHSLLTALFLEVTDVLDRALPTDDSFQSEIAARVAARFIPTRWSRAAW